MAKRRNPQELKAFGAEVLRLREEAGLSQNELAQRASVTRSYISQVEAGATRCRRDFAERLDDALGTGTVVQDAWDELLRAASYPKFFTDFSVAEQGAVILRSYEPRIVWGIFQCEEYARALLLDGDAVAARMRRQGVLTRTPPTTVYCVLEEGTLYRQVNSAKTMATQCERLLEVSEWEHVTLQVAPLQYYRNARAAFTIATQKNGRDIAYLESAVSGYVSSEVEDITFVSSTFSRLQAEALRPSDSRDRIRRALDKWKS